MPVVRWDLNDGTCPLSWFGLRLFAESESGQDNRKFKKVCFSSAVTNRKTSPRELALSIWLKLKRLKQCYKATKQLFKQARHHAWNAPNKLETWRADEDKIGRKKNTRNEKGFFHEIGSIWFASAAICTCCMWDRWYHNVLCFSVRYKAGHLWEFHYAWVNILWNFKRL